MTHFSGGCVWVRGNSHSQRTNFTPQRTNSPFSSLFSSVLREAPHSDTITRISGAWPSPRSPERSEGLAHLHHPKRSEVLVLCAKRQTRIRSPASAGPDPARDLPSGARAWPSSSPEAERSGARSWYFARSARLVGRSPASAGPASPRSQPGRACSLSTRRAAERPRARPCGGTLTRLAH